MNMCIDAAGGEDLPFSRDNFGPGSDDDIDTRLGIRIASLADGANATVLDTYVGFDNTPVIDYQSVADHSIWRIFAGFLALSHAIAYDFAAAKFHFIAVYRIVSFYLNNERAITKSNLIACGGAVHVGVSLSGYSNH